MKDTERPSVVFRSLTLTRDEAKALKAFIEKFGAGVDDNVERGRIFGIAEMIDDLTWPNPR